MLRNGTFRREFTVPFHALQTELNRMFDEYWTPNRVSPSTAAASAANTAAAEPSSWSPPIDVVETTDAYFLTVEVPGVDPATIELSVTGNVMILKGSKPVEEGAAPNGPLRERKFGPFFRQIILPGDVESEGAEAEARFGVLKVRLLKQEIAKPRTIPVQAR